ncbi:C10orf53 [Branchiostoma lanceolatum]|uniref:C10orf53 protein n=1 Tax=Branchiostoma lanceolatum TaxID=7740 RepID=A0A8J9Z2M3_BRALA|nr:C10orf53 [Branchiostoma lanceolatum]
MPANAKVTIRYGKYEACGTVEYREDRLDGLQAVLKADGHQVELKQIEDWNVVELIVNGETVYTCKIKELDFGGDGQLDPLCAEALQAVQTAY